MAIKIIRDMFTLKDHLWIIKIVHSKVYTRPNGDEGQPHREKKRKKNGYIVIHFNN